MLSRRVAFVVTLAICAVTATAASSNDRTLTIYAPDWDGYTNPDGTGFGWAAVRAVFEPEGIKVETKTAPYRRSVKAVLTGQADAWLGAYLDENPEAIYPAWHYDADRFSAVMRREDASSWSGKASLRGADVAWVPGYNVAKYLDIEMGSVRKIDSRQEALRLLKRGMLDYFLDSTWEAKHAMETSPDDWTGEDFAIKHIMNIKLYPAFAPTAEGRRYQRIWDRRLPKLLYSGKLAALYQEHDLIVWPFEHARAE